MKMNVENKLNKVVKILKEKGFVVYRKGGKEPGGKVRRAPVQGRRGLLCVA